MFGLSLPKKKDVGNVFGAVGRGISRGYDQVNIFDSGRSWQTRAPSPEQAQQSVIQQGANSIVKPLVRAPVQTVNTLKAGIGGAYGLGKIGISSTFGTDQGYQNTVAGVGQSLHRDLSPKAGLFGMGTLFKSPQEALDITPRQMTGRSLNTGTQLAQFVAPPIRILRNPVSNRIVNNAGQSMTGSVVGQAVETGRVDPKQTLIDTAAGTAFGEVVPAARGIVRATTKRLPLNEGGYVQVGRTPKNIHPEDQATMADFVDHARGVYKPDPKTAYNLELDAARIAERYGLKMPPSTKGLANEFAKRLDKEGFGKSVDQSIKEGKTPNERFGLEAPKTSYRGVSADEWANVDKGGDFSGKNTKLISMTEDAKKAHEYSKGGLVVEFKPEARTKGGKNTEHMGSTEFRARGLNKNDVAKVTDANGNVIYDASVAPNQSLKNKKSGRVSVVEKVKSGVRALGKDESGKVRIPGKVNVKPKELTSPQKRAKLANELNVARARAKAAMPENTPSLEEAVYGAKIPEPSTSKGESRILGISRGGSPIIKVTRGVQKGVNTAVDKALSSGNPLTYLPARTAQNLFGSLGKTDEAQAAVSRYKGETGLGTDMGLEVERQVSRGKQNKALDYGNPEVRARMVDALDPEVAKVRDPDGKPPKLTPVEAAAVKRLREVSDAAHEEAYQLGIISKEAYEKNKGSYLTRIQEKYEFPEDMQAHWKRNGLRPPDELTKHRKELTGSKLAGQLDDPVYSVSKQIDFLQRNKAIRSFADNISKQKGLVSDSKKIGFVQLGDSPAYGPLAGKFLRKDMYESIMGFGAQSETMGAVYTLLNKWEQNTLRRAAKKTMTIYNPGVRIANSLYNGIIEANLGIPPSEMAAGHAWARKFERSNNPEVLMLRKMGILNSDILSQEIKGRAKVRAKGDPTNTAGKAVKLLKGVDEYVGDSYGRVDDRGKLAAYHALTKQGFSQAEAAKRVGRAFQDYSSVGKLWDISAKVPVFGKAFGRFTGDFVRRATNLAVDKPLTSISMLAGLYMVGNQMSKLSGETPEDKKTREDRVGAGKFPFTNISTEIQTPFGAVDVRRYIGPSVINDAYGGPLEGALSSVLPFDNPVNQNQAGQKELSAKAAGSDPLIGQLVQQGLNRDFRQKPISDPDYFKQTSSGGILGEEEKLESSQQGKNRLKTLARGYTPSFLQTVSDIDAARKGEEDFYGRTKSPTQAVLRGLGVRVENYGADKAAKARDTNKYFREEKPALDAIKKSYFDADPNLKNDWEGLHPKSKDRYGNDIYNESLLNPQKRAMAYLTRPELLKLDHDLAIQQNKNDGKPIDPLLLLPPAQQRSVLLAQGYYQGNGGDEKKVMLYSQPWYDAFRQSRDKYFSERGEYYKKQGFPDQAKDNDDDGYPKASKTVQEKMDYFNSLTEGKRAFLEQNPDAQQYLDDVRAWKNAWRIKVGLPPQDAFGNVIDPRTGLSMGGGRWGNGKAKVYAAEDYIKRYSVGGDVARGTSKRSSKARVSVKKRSSGKVRVKSAKIRLA